MIISSFGTGKQLIVFEFYFLEFLFASEEFWQEMAFY